MATIGTQASITQAIQAVDAYVTTNSQLYTNLSTTITTLTNSGFVGDAANGYKAFFIEKATPVLQETLPGLMTQIKNCLEEMKKLLTVIDPELEYSNKSCGG